MWSRLLEPISTIRWTVALLWQCSRSLTVLGTVLGVAEVVTALVSLYLLKHLVDVVTVALGADGSGDAASVLMAVALTGAAAVLYLVLRGAADVVRQHQGILVSDHVDGRIHETALRADLAFYESPAYFDTLRRARESGTSRPAQVVGNLLLLSKDLIMMAAIAVMVLTLHWMLLPVLLLTMIPALAVRLHFTRVLYQWQFRRTQMERQASYYDWLMTSDLYAKEVRQHRLGEYLRNAYAALRALIRRERLNIAQRRTLVEVGTAVLATIAFFGSLAFLAMQTANGHNTVGDLVLYLLIFQRAQTIAQDLVQKISKLYEDHLYLGLLLKFFAIQPAIQAPAKPRPVPRPMQSGVAFDKVSFTYPGADRPALQNVSLELPPGKLVALVGENGSGKTSLIKLLSRLYDPQAGRVLLDGIDVREFDPEQYRRVFSVIFQDYAHYALTARENIWFGDIDLPSDDGLIQSAARAAGADSVIQRLRNGYDTRLSRMFDDGQEISVGQWQKIALARSFFADSQVVVLDEPTSALDANAEFELFENFRERIGGRAALVISHRLSTVRMADYIYVLDRSQLAEEGSHDALMAQDGIYRQLFQRQGYHFTR